MKVAASGGDNSWPGCCRAAGSTCATITSTPPASSCSARASARRNACPMAGCASRRPGNGCRATGPRAPRRSRRSVRLAVTARLHRLLELIAEGGAQHLDVDDLAVVSIADEVPRDVDVAVLGGRHLGQQLAPSLAQRPDLQATGLAIIARTLHDEAGDPLEHLLLDDLPDLLLRVLAPLADALRRDVLHHRRDVE